MCVKRTKVQMKPLLIVAQFGLLIVISVNSLSINPSSGTKNSINSNNLRNLNQQQQSYILQQAAQHNQAHSTTLPPPLITTISQNNNLDSLAQQFQSINQKLQEQSPNSAAQAGEARSSSQIQQHQPADQQADDSVPLATVNNHSRNNQPPARPLQYVDVSGLVGRERNSSASQSQQFNANGGSNGNGNGNSFNSAGNSSLAHNGASGLVAKSRSGLPECATQQVCNAIFVRMNYTQKLCECSSNYNWKCSHNLDPQDGHTIELTRKFDKRIYTQIKTCEPLREVRACKSPTDWTLLALQSERSGKAHYVVVCKCPTWAQLEGPYTHNHPPYANIPGIRVYGMLCAHQTARSTAQTYAAYNPALSIYPEFPWTEALNVLNTTSNLLSTMDHHQHQAQSQHHGRGHNQHH